MEKALLPATLAAALALLVGCGGDDDARPAGGSTAKATTSAAKIRISNYLYEPDRAVVKAGTRASIKNADDAPHTLTDKGMARTFDSGTVKGKRTGSVTFSRPGTYTYFCEFHPTMAGRVTVTQ